jgi:hypothetical protein
VDQLRRLAPKSPDPYQIKVMILLARGDSAGAASVLQAARQEVEPTAFVAWMATYWDLYWVLPEDQQKLLLRLTPGPFDDNRAAWALALAGTYDVRGDQRSTQAYADSARLALKVQLADAPEDGQLHALDGVALAYLGRAADAVREGERAVALMPLTRDAYVGAYLQHQLVRIRILVGQPDKAMDGLRTLLTIPYFLSPAWLRLDPTFRSLRGRPDFRKVVAAE